MDLNILSEQTHIACLPVAVTINCHSSRESSCIIDSRGIEFLNDEYDFFDVNENGFDSDIKLESSEIEKIRNLQKGSNILLSGDVFVARDAAHKRLFELIEKKQELPFNIKDAIIFYAGPCPSAPGEIIGPIGPTTASRMDKFSDKLYDMGLLATIGKGERDNATRKSIISNSGIYFTVPGGVASLLAQKIVSCEVIAFDDLGAEAIYKLKVQDLPLKVEISNNE